MEALLVSTGIVALAEIGDKTQLLALVLAARYRAPWPIVAGIFLATVLNHAFAGLLGAWVQQVVGPELLRGALAAAFLAMAVWVLVPDELDEQDAVLTPRGRPLGAFAATLVAFFLAEMGDKTQLATVAIAARYDALWAVVTGTTLGMMLANVPVVFLGERVTRRVPIAWVHRAAAVLFVAMGLAVWWGLGRAL